MSTYSNRLQPALLNLLQRVVRFFHPISSCTTTHISLDVQRITLNASCMTILGERAEQLDIFCRITGFTSDFLRFIDVELIRFSHGALQLSVVNLLTGRRPKWLERMVTWTRLGRYSASLRSRGRTVTRRRRTLRQRQAYLGNTNEHLSGDSSARRPSVFHPYTSGVMPKSGIFVSAGNTYWRMYIWSHSNCVIAFLWQIRNSSSVCTVDN